MENFKIKQIGQNIIVVYDDVKLSKKIESKEKRDELINLGKLIVESKSQKVKEKYLKKLLVEFEKDKVEKLHKEVAKKAIEKKIKKVTENPQIKPQLSINDKIKKGETLTEDEKKQIIDTIENAKLIEQIKNERIVVSSTRRPE